MGNSSGVGWCAISTTQPFGAATWAYWATGFAISVSVMKLGRRTRMRCDSLGLKFLGSAMTTLATVGTKPESDLPASLTSLRSIGTSSERISKAVDVGFSSFGFGSSGSLAGATPEKRMDSSDARTICGLSL